jgi:hypothetical protein
MGGSMNVDGKINNSKTKGAVIVELLTLSSLLAIPQGVGVDTNVPSHIYMWIIIRVRFYFEARSWC